jgi:hypothetical protein
MTIPKTKSKSGEKRNGPTKLDMFNAFVDTGMAHLDSIGCAGAIRVWVVYWRHADGDTLLAWPSLLTVAEKLYGKDKAEKNKPIIQRWRAMLVEHGFLVLFREGRGGRPRMEGGGAAPAVYRVCLPKIVASEATTEQKTIAPQAQTVASEAQTVASQTPEEIKEEVKEENSVCAEHTTHTQTPDESSPKVEAGDSPEAIWTEERRASYPAAAAPTDQEARTLRATLQKLGNDRERLRDAVRRYFACRESYEVNAGHSVALFAKQFDKWANPRLTPTASPRGAPSMDRAAQQESRIAAQVREALADIPTGRAIG